MRLFQEHRRGLHNCLFQSILKILAEAVGVVAAARCAREPCPFSDD